MFEIPVWLIAATFVAGLCLLSAAGIVTFPRVATVSDMRHEVRDLQRTVAIETSTAAELRRKIEATTGSTVALKELLRNAETSLSDAQARLSMQEVQLRAYETVIAGLRHQVAKAEAVPVEP